VVAPCKKLQHTHGVCIVSGLAQSVAVDAHDGVRCEDVRAGVLAGTQHILQLHPRSRANELHVIFDQKCVFIGATWLHLDCDPERRQDFAATRRCGREDQRRLRPTHTLSP
jgi:hypothetical protein